ncbi:hypothetical protein ICG_05545 [Bacillus cereus BAG1X1-3]|nr:hypothetical protein ICG_05545 [Bacillus cereus BAG1X1-3]EOO75368.1 hypothetical protein IC7_05445 [Bacillus cereus BAG1O-1]PEX41591.1 hypothetical protein CN464_28080 [Bacillus cereus]PFJ95516.1 hypothetical protein COI97_22365 [Bacillus cereus]PFM26805.1 hypothetical protein COJ42_27060 [Bacillus cereus]
MLYSLLLYFCTRTLDEMYSGHKEEAWDVFMLKKFNDPVRIKEILDLTDNLSVNITYEYLENLIFKFKLQDNKYTHRPLSRLLHDTYKYLE